MSMSPIAVAYMFTIDTMGQLTNIVDLHFRPDRGVLNVDRDVPVAPMIGVDTMGRCVLCRDGTAQDVDVDGAGAPITIPLRRHGIGS